MDETEIVETIISILNIPQSWLEWPYILTYIMLPIGFNTAGFYYFLNNKLRIFNSSGVNFTLAFILAFVAMPFGWTGMLLGIGMIALFGIEMWYNRIAFILIILLIISLFYVGVQTQYIFITIALLLVFLSFRIQSKLIRIVVIVGGLALLFWFWGQVEEAVLTYGLT